MKRLLIFSFALMLFSSCEEDFLELTPISSPNVADFFQNEGDILNAVNAAYATLQSGNLYGGRDLQDLTEYRADNTFDNDPSAGSGQRFNIDVFLAGSANEIIEDVWQSFYQAIYRCNVVLDNIDDVDMDPALKERSRAEVRFIRALCYFNAVQLWGPVPLVLSADNTEESRDHIRNGVNEIYAAMEADLQFAATNLPASYSASETGRVTSGAANALLGKVFLTEQKYGEAENALRAVMSSGQYELLPTVAEVFDPSNEYNAEIIFAIVFTEENVEEDHGLFYGSGIGDMIQPGFREIYPEGDQRRDLLELVTPEGTATVVPQKFFAPLSAAGTVGTDFPVLRYADVLLMLAEALNEQGSQEEALELLNQVRTRAGAAAYAASDLSSQNDLRDAVLLERRLELPLESHRWFDLLRTGRAIEAMAAIDITISSDDLLFPIPNSQIQIYNNPSGFPQNPGY